MKVNMNDNVHVYVNVIVCVDDYVYVNVYVIDDVDVDDSPPITFAPTQNNPDPERKNSMARLTCAAYHHRHGAPNTRTT